MTQLLNNLKNKILNGDEKIIFYCNISKPDILTLFHLLKSINKTKILNLSFITFDEEIFNAFNEYLLIPNCHLQELNLSHSLSSFDFHSDISNALKKLFQNTSLIKLTLNDNKINKYLSAIGEGLETNKTLQSLSLTNNLINTDQFKNFITLLLKNTTLLYLNLTSNQISDAFVLVQKDFANTLLSVELQFNPLLPSQKKLLQTHQQQQFRQQCVAQTIAFFQIAKYFNVLPPELWMFIFSFIPFNIDQCNVTKDQLNRMQALVACNLFSHHKNHASKSINKHEFWKKELSITDIDQLNGSHLLINKEIFRKQFLQKNSFVIFKTKSYQTTSQIALSSDVQVNFT